MAEKKKTAPKKKEYVTVNCPLLNVRVKPDITSARLTQVSGGVKLEKLGEVNEWYKIKTDGITGYVMAEFVV